MQVVEIWVAVAIIAMAIAYAMGVLPVVIEFPEGRYFVCDRMSTILALNRVGLVGIRKGKAGGEFEEPLWFVRVFALLTPRVLVLRALWRLGYKGR